MTRLRVRDVMTRDVVTVPPEETIGAAVDRVLCRGHTHLVVVDGSGRLADIISAHLLTTALMTRLVARRQPLADVLTDAATIRADADLADAASRMLDLSVDALGVVDRAGRLVGVLTWTDIGRSVAAPAADRAERRDGP
jgi:CBS-domain-containing membrane protein